MRIARLTSALRRLLCYSIAALAGSLLLAAPATSVTPSAWVEGLWPDAAARGIPRRVFEASLGGFEPSSRIMELTRAQPEVTSTIGTYVTKRITEAQVNNGRRQAAEWRQTLGSIEGRYGVQGAAVLAIWGMETNFGGYMGGNNTMTALATLTYGGYRSDYFKNELMTAMQIVTDGHIDPSHMVGSWAGAMGHTQFMPSSFMRYAVDHNGDGRKDIWNSVPDALASSANYLKQHGWRSGETWGYEIALPRGFDYGRAWTMKEASVAEWAAMGITRKNGKPFPRASDRARIFMPAGGGGPTFLLLPNFDVIKRYNNSDSYALAVGHLMDRIVGGGSFLAPWPADEVALNKSARVELQTLLARRGYDPGPADGVIGTRTRLAIIAYQRDRGFRRADGHPSGALLQSLR